MTSASASLLATISQGTLPAGITTTVVTGLTIPAGAPLGTYEIIAEIQTPTPDTTVSNNTTSATLEVSPSSTSTATTSSTTGEAATSSTEEAYTSGTEEAYTSSTEEAYTSSTEEAYTSGTEEAYTSGTEVVGWGRCDYYASPTGRSTNSGLSTSSPIRIQDFWAKPNLPGKTLCLLGNDMLTNGLYRGSANMIAPPAGLSGTSSARITVRCLNEGECLIDGQFTNQPVTLRGSSWFELVGFNATRGRGSTGTRGAVIALWEGANNNIVRRVVAWDQAGGFNSDMVTNYSSTNNLWEDVAFFGMTARKLISCGGRSSGTNTFRRVWGRWEGGFYGGSRGATMFYNTFGCRIENGLLTWSGESQPQTYTEVYSGARMTNFAVTSDSKGPAASDRMDTGTPQCTRAELYGSLVYLRNGAKFLTNSSGGPTTGASIINLRNANCITLRHVYAFIDPAWSNFGQYRGFFLGNLRDGSRPSQVSASNITSVRHPARLDSFTSGWLISGHSAGATVASVPSAFTATTSGANLCMRWVNGRVTSDPLWPWPMNQRIKEATAAAGSYSGPCLNCSGGRLARRATDVTAEVQAILGPIPSQCKR